MTPESERSRTRHLAAAARSGSDANFESLYERVAPALYAWARLRIARHLAHRVEPDDVVQEVFCRACRIFATAYDPSRIAFRAWVFRIAKNVLYEALRSAGSSPSMPGRGRSSQAFSAREIPASATSITQRVARREDVARLVEAVEALSREDRDLATWCGLEGRQLAEVATRLGIGTEAAKKRWQRLRARLRQQLEDDDLLTGADA